MLGMEWIPTFFFSFPSLRDDQFPRNKWAAMSLPFKVAYVLGWRHLLFRASAIVLDGVVAKTAFGIEPDAFFGWPASDFVVVRSAHGFWLPHTLEVPVPSTDDESPDFRYGPVAGAWSSFSGADSTIGVVFTASAPAELVSHAFQLDLNCFWGISRMRLYAAARPAPVGGPTNDLCSHSRATRISEPLSRSNSRRASANPAGLKCGTIGSPEFKIGRDQL